MDLQKLQRFCAIARSQNMSQAARELFLSEPALSRTLKQIEEELGVSLFTRRGKRLELNDAGAILLKCAEEVETQIGLARREIDMMKITQSRIVKVNLDYPLGEAWMGKGPIASFLRLYPEANIEITHHGLLSSSSWDIKLSSSATEPKDDRFVIGIEGYSVLLPSKKGICNYDSIGLSELSDFKAICFRSVGNKVLLDDLSYELAKEKISFIQLGSPFIADAINAVRKSEGFLIVSGDSMFDGDDLLQGVAKVPLAVSKKRFILWEPSSFQDDISSTTLDFVAHLEKYFAKTSKEYECFEFCQS